MLDALTPNLAAGKEKIAAALSGHLGSIENTDMSFGLAYRVSKAGPDTGQRTAAHTLSAEGITLEALHPRRVKTDMDSEGVPVEPADSAAGLCQGYHRCGPLERAPLL
ncbi:hypothetical protein [Hyphomonas sp.]|uniref:hypothetical protein n=1 Tax=Hyphomonas sp. TaxID=87 RepID=UPI0037C0438D